MIKKRHLELIVSQSEPLEPSESPAKSALEPVYTDVSAEVTRLDERRLAHVRDKLAVHSMAELQSMGSGFDGQEDHKALVLDLNAELQEIEQMIDALIASHGDTLDTLTRAQKGAIKYIRSCYESDQIADRSKEEQKEFFFRRVEPLRERMRQLSEKDIVELQRLDGNMREALAALADDRVVRLDDFRTQR